MPAGPPSWPSWSNRKQHELCDNDLESSKARAAGYNYHDGQTKHSSRRMLGVFDVYHGRRLSSVNSSVLLVLLGMLLGYAITHTHPSSLWPAFSTLQVFPTTNATPPDLILPAKLPSPFSDAAYFYPPLEQQHYPAVPAYNVLPDSSSVVRDARKRISQSPLTPLFVPFTRNAGILVQTVLSYIAAGWPRSQIYVIDNSGTMDANARGKLTAANPFSLDYELLCGRYGVNIVRTPTLLSFAQLQNYMLSTAMTGGWEYFYWTPQDVAVLSNETVVPYRSFYEDVVRSLVDVYDGADAAGWTAETLAEAGRRDRVAAAARTVGADEEVRREQNPSARPWGTVFYASDWLALVNVRAAADEKVGIGAWDTFIPYYGADCDYYERLRLAGWALLRRDVGMIYDVAEQVRDVEGLFFGEDGEHAVLRSDRYLNATRQLMELAVMKNSDVEDSSVWQAAQTGGRAELWTYDPEGFESAWWYMADTGRRIYRNKWGTENCRPSWEGKGLEDIWRPRKEHGGKSTSDVMNEEEEYTRADWEMRMELERQIERQRLAMGNEDGEDRCPMGDAIIMAMEEDMEMERMLSEGMLPGKDRDILEVETQDDSKGGGDAVKEAGGATQSS
ncbi:hypothetical protein TWF696_000261 [Orbilia brochopaga]|uniref:Uncharacterized protein n=1 Tax=Orbilia brochopaga TaxID=3140254 RepID=A0AAV9VB61_9PEZI